MAGLGSNRTMRNKGKKRGRSLGEHRTGSRSVESLALLMSETRRITADEEKGNNNNETKNGKIPDERGRSTALHHQRMGGALFSPRRRRTKTNLKDTIHVYQPTDQVTDTSINPDRPVKAPRSFQISAQRGRVFFEAMTRIDWSPPLPETGFLQGGHLVGVVITKWRRSSPPHS